MINRRDHIDALKILGAYAPDKTPNPDEAILLAHKEYTDRYQHWTGDDWVTAAHELSKRPRERMVQPADLGEIVKSIRRDRYERTDPDIRDNPFLDLGGTPKQPPEQPQSKRYVDPDGGYIDANGVRRDRYGYVDKSAPEIEYPDHWTTEQRLDAYWKHVRAQKPEYAGLMTPPASAAARQQAMDQITKTLGNLPEDDLPRINVRLVACPFCEASKGGPCVSREYRRVTPLQGFTGHPSRIEAAAIAMGHTPQQAEIIANKIHQSEMAKHPNLNPSANTSRTPQPVPCPDCGSLGKCDHDQQPPPDALNQFNRITPHFPDSDARDREYRRQLGAAGLDVVF